MDLRYIDNWSLWLDFQIILRTIPAVLWQGGEVILFAPISMASVSSVFWVFGFTLSVVIAPQLRIWTWGPAMLCFAISSAAAIPLMERAQHEGGHIPGHLGNRPLHSGLLSGLCPPRWKNSRDPTCCSPRWWWRLSFPSGRASARMSRRGYWSMGSPFCWPECRRHLDTGFRSCIFTHLSQFD